MSSITAQQTKLDFELVPNKKMLEIRKCNGRINPGKKQREPTFQVVLDTLALTPCYSSFLTTSDVTFHIFRSMKAEEPDSPEAAPLSPDYVPGPEEPEQVPPSPNYVLGPEYPEYLAPADDEIVAEDQPYADYASPAALSPRYVADSDLKEDPEEDLKDGPVDYPADGGDDDDDDDSSDDDGEEEASEEEEEHLALADSVIAPTFDYVPSFEETEPFETDESAATPPPPPHAYRTTTRMSIQAQAPMPFPSKEEVEILISLPTPPSSPLISLSPPSAEEHLARCLAAPALPSLPLPPLPSSLYLPPPVPTSLPVPSPPLPPLPASLFIPLLVDRREDIPEAELPPHKRLCLTTHTSRYEVRESLTTAIRHTRGHRADYGFISTMDAKIRRQRAEEVGYGIRDVWVDPTKAVEEVAPMTLEGVNARVTELVAVQKEDTQDIYAVAIDYTLWEIIENGNVAIVTKNVNGKDTINPPTTVEEKAQRRADLKARSTFFGGNTATKKTQKNLLKQQYENFIASSTEVIKQTYERLQQLISQLEIHGEVISQEDINQKFLRSLAPRNQDNRNKEPTRRTVPVEETTSSALVSQCDGFGYDWSDQAKKKCVKDLKEQNEQLVKDLRTAKIRVVSYKTGLESLEARLLVFKKNEFVYEEDIKLLKRYNVVLPPYTGNFMPPKPDLVYPSLDDFVDVNESVSESVVEKPTVEIHEPKTARKENKAPIIEDLVSESEEDDVSKTVEMFNKPSFGKINFVKSIEQVKSLRNTSVDKNRQNTPSPRGNKRNWNQKMSQKLGNNFEMFNKTCLVCGSFDHLKKDCNNCPKRNMVPRTVLTRSGLITLNIARLVNTVQPRTAVNNEGLIKNVINKVYSTARRPFNKITAANNSNFNQEVNTVKDNVNTVRLKAVVNTTRPKTVLSAVKGNKGNAIKASACWDWRPKQKVLDHVSRNNGLSMSFKRFDYIDAQGRSKRMTGNRSYLTHYEEIDGGFVIFGGNSKGGKITRKDTECVVLSPDFKLTNESHVLLKIPRKDNMYSVDLKNVVPQGGKFDGKADEGFFIRYSTNSKAFRVFNSRTRIVEENLHVKFSEDTPNIERTGPNWLFDIDALTKSMSYKPVVAGNQSNRSAYIKACDNAGKARVEKPGKDYILLPLWSQDLPFSSSSKDSPDAEFKPSWEEEKKDAEDLGNEDKVNVVDENIVYSCADDPNMHELEEIGIFSDAENDNSGVFRNKKDERGIMIKNKERSVGQGYTQEEGIDYDEVFSHVARIEAIRLFLAYASFKDFAVYQMDVKSAFLYGKIEEEVYVCQPLGFEDPNFPDRQKENGIFISQDKYVTEILKKFGFSDVKTASTPMETHKPWLKDADGEDVDEHLYRSMIGSLMYLTSSRPDIMFAVCACVRFQVNPKNSHLYAVKRIFRYLKDQPKLGLWYPKDSPFDLWHIVTVTMQEQA
ncbi:retrovirus-related pol polyprotein from transposon TNT 1-94 [Tanacetum coccineum]